MLQLADGGQLAMDWLDMETEDANLPVLVILPGLTGLLMCSYVINYVLVYFFRLQPRELCQISCKGWRITRLQVCLSNESICTILRNVNLKFT